MSKIYGGQRTISVLDAMYNKGHTKWYYYSGNIRTKNVKLASIHFRLMKTTSDCSLEHKCGECESWSEQKMSLQLAQRNQLQL